MSKRLYVSAAEPYSGKVLISLGILEAMSRTLRRVGFFRPVARPYVLASGVEVLDRDVHLMHEVYALAASPEQMIGVGGDAAERAMAEGGEAALHERILEQFKELEEQCDFVLCEGTDFLSATTSVEAELNGDIARNLNAPVLLVVDGSSNDVETIYSKAKIGIDSFGDKGCEVIGVIINKVDASAMLRLEGKVSQRLSDEGVRVFGKIAAEPALRMPSMAEVLAHLDGEVLFGQGFLSNKVDETMVASGSVETMLPLLDDNMLLVSHIDRHDAIFMVFTSLLSRSAANIGGVVLSGEHDLAEPVARLLQGLPGPCVPIVRSPCNTYETVLALTSLKTGIEPSKKREIEVARQLFDSSVDVEAVLHAVRGSETHLMTPSSFKYELLQRARAQRKTIVLPEGSDERILRATDALLRQKVVDLVLLGDADGLRNQAGQLGLDLDGAEIVDPSRCEWLESFAEIYQQCRKHKGMTLDAAREHVIEPPVFGTLMVHTGRADGMVAGATHSTAMTIRPAFQVIKTQPGSNLVSSVFFMCLEDRVLVYGDCAVNPDPSAPELAEIALQSARTARAFGIEPLVAMLSYSTGESGQGADVDKVKEAVRIAKQRQPDLIVDGPLQYDAAVDMGVAHSKLPDSRVGGRATVFVFPDLNTGNNTYKAVQRSAHAVAVGPVLQGLNKPVNDLSRGCLVEDIVNTVAITAIQAQAEEG